MKQIVNYIKEAFITKANIKTAANANKDRFNVSNLTPFPKLQFHPANDKSAKMLSQWLSENNLFPEIDEIKGKPGKWIVWVGISAYCVSFKFDELVDGYKADIWNFIKITNKDVDIINISSRYDIYDLMQEDSKLCLDVYNLIDCIKKAMNINEAFITKDNIKKAIDANKSTERFNVDTLTPFPKIFDMDNHSVGKQKLVDWLDKNELWPSVKEVDGHKGEWIVVSSSSAKLCYYEIGFHFLEKDLGNFLPFINIKWDNAKVVNRTQVLSAISFNTYDLLNEESQLCLDVYGLCDCLNDILNKK